jgi:hypothetical protein
MEKVIQICSWTLARTLIAWAKFLYVVAGLTFAAFLMAGLWELAAWALRADWRTSGFEIPAVLLLIVILLGAVAYGSYLIGRGFKAVAAGESENPGSAAYYLMVVCAGILIIGTILFVL